MSEALTVGHLMLVVLLVFGAAHIWSTSKKDVYLNEFKKVQEQHEARIRQNEDNITRLVAIQERIDLEMKGIHKRHELADAKRKES